MIQPFKTKRGNIMTTTLLTKHFSSLSKLMTFKIQWNGETVEQDFDNIMLNCEEGKIEITHFHRNEYDENSDPESLGFYSTPVFPAFICSDEKVNKINHYFQTNDYPLEISYYKMSPELVFIHGFSNLFGSDKVIQLETILDDVLAILMSEDESKDE